jgi:hypothetical protein
MVDKYPDFWHVIAGSGPLGAFLGYIVIAFICADVSLLIEASNRNLSSKNTPVKFSWSFLVAANIPRLIANFLCIPIVIRLCYEYIDMKWMIFLSIGIGFAVDRLGMLLKNVGVLTSNKLAQGVADKLAPTDPTITPKQ